MPEQPKPPPTTTIPKCDVHNDNYAAGFCLVCKRFVCYPCGMAHQAAHERRN